MFSEEQTNNACRKRQEKNRIRRRQLKKQQNTKTSSETTDDSKRLNEIKITSVDRNQILISSTKTHTLVENILDPKDATVTTNNKTASVIKNVTEQRKNHQSSATKIQSFYRMHTSNLSLYFQQLSSLQGRITDVIKLCNLLEKAKGVTYTLPPNVANAMLNQLMFVTHCIPHMNKNNMYYSTVQSVREETAVVLCQIIKFIILPGIQQKDPSLDPLLPWLDSKVDQVRLKKFLRLCWVFFTKVGYLQKENDEELGKFWRVLLLNSNGKVRELLVKYCENIFLSSKTNVEPPYLQGCRLVGSNPICFEDLNLISLVRLDLLFPSRSSETGSKLVVGPVIPPNAEKMRERVIPPKLVQSATSLFQLMMDVVLHRNDVKMRCRIVTDILTIPLLTWRINSSAISKLILITSQNRESPMISMVNAFISDYEIEISNGKIGSLLPSNDIPLRICPAPPVLCLLANLVQLGRLCESVNGSSFEKLDYDAAVTYFNLVSELIKVAPLGAFSSDKSSVEWIKNGTHLSPIVLSPVILDQCKGLLVDSYVRQLFDTAINEESLGTEKFIHEMNEKDLKHEKDMKEVELSSAVSLAAKEAMVDRSVRGFWLSSKWAKKISKGVVSLFSEKTDSSNNSILKIRKEYGRLVNITSQSRKLASEGKELSNVMISKKNMTVLKQDYSPSFFFTLCRGELKDIDPKPKLYASILSRWGGGGKEDLVKRVETVSKNDEIKLDVLEKSDPCMLSLLNVLCFSTNILRATWGLIQSDRAIISDLYALVDPQKSPPIRSLSMWENNNGSVLLFMFTSCLSHSLIITDDTEIHEMERPLPLHQIRRCILLLKKMLHRVCCIDDVESYKDNFALQPSSSFGLSLIFYASKVMQDLYDRSSRRPLCVPKLWLIENLLEKDLQKCKILDDYIALLNYPVLRICPYFVSFKRRLFLFQKIVTTSRISIQGSNAQHTLQPGVVVHINRKRILEDGLMYLNRLGKNLRRRVVVQFLNHAGSKEAGVDIGGVFKEFWTDLSNLAFNPNYALFRVTDGAGNCLYPNPLSLKAHGLTSIDLFEFLGRILGKAIYEGITIQPKFAHFFLSFLRGDYNFLHMLPDLSTMDPTLYNNLMFLKTFEGDAQDLFLTFSVTNDDFGHSKEIELVPGGASIDVTNYNKHKYIGLIAKHHVYDRIKDQSEAFTKGLWDVIDKNWLKIFSEPELQVLISGAADATIDLSDMKKFTCYSGGYTGLDRNIRRFWSVVSLFTSKQHADLLRFVTSCERPPPLGFASMNPPFTIQRVGISSDSEKLPSASTCFNTLKLPTYSNEKVLHKKLLYVLNSGAGFELA